MALLELNEIAIQTDYVTHVGQVKSAATSGALFFYVYILGVEKPVELRFKTQLDADSTRTRLLGLMNTKGGNLR